TLPESIARLHSLETLSVRHNHIGALSEFVGPTGLKVLDLSDNKLRAIPESLAELANLQRLDISNNQLTTIPASLSQLAGLTALFLHGNSELGIPDEILGPKQSEIVGPQKPKPPREILDYFSRLADSRPLNEAKLIMVGQGAVGKSSLIK